MAGPGARRVSGAVVLALLLAGAAGAQQSAVDATGDYLQRMDLDRDGLVGLSEYQDWLSYGFDAMDADRDQVLQAAELPGGRGKAVTRAEYRARLATTFNRQDRNRDGRLDARELASPPQ
ncbi:MAG TPA: calcium-dependent protein kinase 21 [Luteimonas sp.]|nr:calcium-dependent protein kinase 21 [Luteimonas sp.]